MKQEPPFFGAPFVVSPSSLIYKAAVICAQAAVITGPAVLVTCREEVLEGHSHSPAAKVSQLRALLQTPGVCAEPLSLASMLLVHEAPVSLKSGCPMSSLCEQSPQSIVLSAHLGS